MNIKIKEALRFILVGLVCTLVHYLLYYVLKQFMGINRAYSVGYALSFCLNFYLSNTYTFKTRANVLKGIGFGLSHLINYGVHLLLLNLFLYAGLSETLAPVPVFAIAIPLNFLLVRTVLKSKKL